LSDASYLRTIFEPEYDPQLPSMPSISWVGITNEGSIIWYSEADYKFHLYSLMGIKIHEKEVTWHVFSITLSNDRQYVIVGGDEKTSLFIMRLYDFAFMETVKKIQTDPKRIAIINANFNGEGVPARLNNILNLNVAIRTVRTSPDEQFIFLGLQNGEVYVVAAK
jgi:hypothetical protein